VTGDAAVSTAVAKSTGMLKRKKKKNGMKII